MNIRFLIPYMNDPMDFDREELREKAEEAIDQRLESSFDTDVEQRIEKMEKQREKIKSEAESKIPFTWDPVEIQYLTENRKKMDNEELKEFLKKDSDIQEEMRDIDDWKRFSRREERFIVKKYTNMEPEQIAEKLDRDERKVRLKMRSLGLKTDNF